jgi:hypothetical protein
VPAHAKEIDPLLQRPSSYDFSLLGPCHHHFFRVDFVEDNLCVPLSKIFLGIVIMTEASHPFRVLEEFECVLRLPDLFGPEVDVLELNLSDTTNGRRIAIPGRGSKCDHIDVVDVCTSTLATSPGSLEWMCPVCGMEYSSTEDIEVDGLMSSILRELDSEDPEGKVRAINLKISGEWEHVSDDPSERVPMIRKKRARLTLAQATAVAGLSSEIVLSDSDDESPARSKSKVSQPEIVDLDSD